MTEKDKAMHKGLLKMLNDATFPLKAREVSAFVDVFTWAQDLPNLLKKEEPVKEVKKTVRKKAK